MILICLLKLYNTKWHICCHFQNTGQLNKHLMRLISQDSVLVKNLVILHIGGGGREITAIYEREIYSRYLQRLSRVK